MALVECPNCGKTGVSTHSDKCPECGYNVKKYYQEKYAEERKAEEQKRIKQEQEQKEIKEKELERQRELEIQRENERRTVCPECGKEFLAKLKACPHCGLSMEDKEQIARIQAINVLKENAARKKGKLYICIFLEGIAIVTLIFGLIFKAGISFFVYTLVFIVSMFILGISALNDATDAEDTVQYAEKDFDRFMEYLAGWLTICSNAKTIPSYMKNNLMCPYCKSKNTKLYSTKYASMYQLFTGVPEKKIGISWYCKECKSYF